MPKLLKIHPADNVAVALADMAQGEEELGIALLQPLARGHKAALRDIAQGEDVVKYGFPIGHATRPIRRGEHVHSHNLATSLGGNLQYEYHPAPPAALPSPDPGLAVSGYLRASGEMGIRNELWIVPTVGCVNSQACQIAELLRAEGALDIADDVRALTHNYGCSQLGQDHANTRAALCSIIRHPNAGGVLVLGLGCENNQMQALKECLGEYDAARVRFLVAQEAGDEVAEGVGLCRELLQAMRADKRQPLPAALLKVGLKCGGSDGLSGITANPLAGMFADWLVANGGTAVLTEVPEMFGAETMLMDRCKDRETFEKAVALINDFKDYFRAAGQPVCENPSPGNKAGGITTLEEKSLGCVQKGGTAPVADVLAYAQRASQPGLNLLQAPGNDLVASTALALAGCQLVLFTTGRGTPFGTFVPTLKISTNSDLARRKPAWIDFDAGAIAEGEPAPQALARLISLVLSTADGQPARNEQAGAKEIAIFKTGVTL